MSSHGDWESEGRTRKTILLTPNHHHQHRYLFPILGLPHTKSDQMAPKISTMAAGQFPGKRSLGTWGESKIATDVVLEKDTVIICLMGVTEENERKDERKPPYA